MTNVNMREQVAALDPEDRASIEELLRKTHEEYQQKARDILEMLLSDRNECKHRNHRTKPETPRDWTAVNNLLVGVAAVLNRALSNFTRLSVVHGAAVRRAPATTEEEMLKEFERANELVEHGMVAQIAAWVIGCHFQLVATHDELPDMADIHADRLRGMVRPLMERTFAAKTLDETAQAFGKHGL